jgi:hypothetical protein
MAALIIIQATASVVVARNISSWVIPVGPVRRRSWFGTRDLQSDGDVIGAKSYTSLQSLIQQRVFAAV